MVLDKTLQSPLDSKEIKPINPKGNQPGIVIGRKLMLKLKLQYFGYLVRRADTLETTLMLGRTEGRGRRERQRMRWLVGWHHQINGHEFEQTPGDGEEQGSLVCCGPWSHKELDTT